MKLRVLLPSVLLAFITSSSFAAFPTVEVGPQLIQNIIMRIQQAQQLLEQIEQRKIENQQYQINIRDFANPSQSQYLWSQPSSNIREMVANTNNINSIRDYVSTLQQLLEQYKTYKDYARTPCFAEGACDEKDRQQLTRMISQANEMNSELGKSSSNGMAMLLERQKRTLQSDADKLQTLERNATTPRGRNEALAYANQFASAQANQLMQMRALMVAQQNIVVMQMKEKQAQEDMRRVADASMISGPLPELSRNKRPLSKSIENAQPR